MTIIPGLINISNQTTNTWPQGGNAAGYILFNLLVGCTLLAAFILCTICIYKKLQEPDDTALTIPEIHNCFYAWTFPQIEDATDNFSIEKSLLGKGRYGPVYEAILPDEHVMAVRRIDPSLVLLHKPDYLSAAIRALSRAQHRNIVPVLGFCEAPAERILVMEFMPGKTLQYHLHEGGIAFDWCHRLKIATEAAQGIEYLHEGTDPCIIHGDIKPSNILLDQTWSARVSDFGLSFLSPPNEMFGAVGYLDPEYFTQMKLSKASDIYSFGVVLLEILSGRPCLDRDFSEPRSITEWAVPLITNSRAREIFDPKLQLPVNPEPLIRAAKLACECVSNVRKHRPTIWQVVVTLKDVEREINMAGNSPLYVPGTS